MSEPAGEPEKAVTDLLGRGTDPAMLPLVLDSMPEHTSAQESAELERAYDTYAAEMFRFLRRLGVPDAAVDDAVQDVFFVAWRRRAEFEGRSSQRTWLYGIARRVARDHRRRRDRTHKESPELDQLSTGSDPARQSEAAEAARLVDRVLARMSDTLRETFVLVEIEQLSAPEIAEVVGVPLNTVYSRTRLARDKFRELASSLLEPGRSRP